MLVCWHQKDLFRGFNATANFAKTVRSPLPGQPTGRPCLYIAIGAVPSFQSGGSGDLRWPVVSDNNYYSLCFYCYDGMFTKSVK